MKYINLILITFFFTYSAFCQEVLKKEIELNQIEKVNIFRTEYDSINAGLYKSYYEVFKKNFSDYLFEAGVKDIEFSPEIIKFESPDQEQILNITKNYQSEYLLVSKIFFLRRSFLYKSFLNIDKLEKTPMFAGNPDIFIAIRIYDKNGELVIWTTHKVLTGANSFADPEWTIEKGINNSIAKIKKSKFVTVDENNTL